MISHRERNVSQSRAISRLCETLRSLRETTRILSYSRNRRAVAGGPPPAGA